MKKLIIPFLSILALTACEKEDTTIEVDAPVNSSMTYYQSRLLDNVNADFSRFIDSAEDHRLQANLLFPSVPSNETNNYKAPLCTYHYSNENYHDLMQWFLSYMYQSRGIPLCTVTSTSSAYSRWHNDYTQYSSCYHLYCDANESGLFRSREMNQGAGDYLYAWFGTSRKYATRYWPESLYCDDETGVKFFDYTYKLQASTDAPITGLALIVDESDNYQKVIYDQNGVAYYPVVGLSGSVDDWNNNGGGEYLHLYYTNDPATGRKLMFTHPDMELYSQCINWNDQHGGTTLANAMMFSFPLSWMEEEKSRDNAYTVDQLKKILKDNVVESASSVDFNLDLAFCEKYNKLVDNNFDFIRAYNVVNGVMYPWAEGYPGNFQEGKSENRLFISYSYVTPDQAEYWDMF